jgi:hypothetical protein
MSHELGHALGTDTTDYLTSPAVVHGLADRNVKLEALSVRPDGTHQVPLPDGGWIVLGTDDDDSDPTAWWDFTEFDSTGDPLRTDGGTLAAVLDAIAEMSSAPEPPESWTLERVATEYGYASTDSARRALWRWGVRPIARQPGRAGMNVYDAHEVRTAAAQRVRP